MNKVKSPTEEEMLDALGRSGYLLEAEIAHLLTKSAYFIETNQVIEDPITGKSREIDLLAEYFNHNPEASKYKVHSKIHLVIEIKNNPSPIVLINAF